jgi:hypothetical protein
MDEILALFKRSDGIPTRLARRVPDAHSHQRQVLAVGLRPLRHRDPRIRGGHPRRDADLAGRHARPLRASHERDELRALHQGDPKQGIHITNGWSRPTANDLQAVNRLYLPSIRDRAVLVIYRAGTGYINTNYLTYGRGIPEVSVAHVSPQYTAMAGYMSEGQTHLLTYEAKTGVVATSIITSLETPTYGVIRPQWTGQWQKGYSLFATYESNGQSHIIVYRPNGSINTNRISMNGAVREIWHGDWTSRYSLMATYQVNGTPHVIVYKAHNGEVNTNRINANGSITELWNGQWPAGHTLMVTYVSQGQPHLVMYRGSDGHMNTSRLEATGRVTTLHRAVWRPHYTAMATGQVSNTPYLVIYRGSDGYINANSIAADGAVTEVWNHTWSTGYTQLAIL